MADPYRPNKSGVYSVDTPHSSIDNLIAKNTLSDFLSTTGGKNIFGQEVAPLTEDELLMMIMPMAGSIRGGKVAKTTLEQLLGLSKKLGLKPPKGITAGDLRGKGLENILNRTASSVDKIKYAKAREAYDSVLKKHKIADPDKQGMVDPVSALLNYFSKN